MLFAEKPKSYIQYLFVRQILNCILFVFETDTENLLLLLHIGFINFVY